MCCVAALKSLELRRALQQASKAVRRARPGPLVAAEARTVWAASEEENLRPMDGSGLGRPRRGGEPGGDGAAARGNTALDRFSRRHDGEAASGKMDPIVGRDDEIRQIIDVLMRRRQNNPILTGEAGVGKTAVVEGFAQRLASGDVPPQLKGVKLCVLDIGLMQAGASMKGEFEQRLRSVIDEVQASPDADHPVHRRDPHPDRRRRPGGHRRRRQPAEAGAGARHAAHHRRHHLVGIPPSISRRTRR